MAAPMRHILFVKCVDSNGDDGVVRPLHPVIQRVIALLRIICASDSLEDIADRLRMPTRRESHLVGEMTKYQVAMECGTYLLQFIVAWCMFEKANYMLTVYMCGVPLGTCL